VDSGELAEWQALHLLEYEEARQSEMERKAEAEARRQRKS